MDYASSGKDQLSAKMLVEYRYDLKTGLTIGILGTLAGAVLILFALGLSGDSFVDTRCQVASVVIMGFSLYTFAKTIIKGSHRIRLQPEGLVSILRGQATTYYWDEIAAVVRRETRRYTKGGMYLGTDTTYSVVRMDGTTLTISPDLKRHEQLGERIEQETFRRIMPLAQAAYQSGKAVSFGELAISPPGLLRAGNLLPWHNIRDIKVETGVVIIERLDSNSIEFNTNIGRIGNLEVFLALTREIMHTSTN